MKKSHGFWIVTHRVSGAFIALFFLMWFISGLVLFYHPFPYVKQEQVFRHKEALPDSLPSIEILTKELKNQSKFNGLILHQKYGQTLYSYFSKDSIQTYCIDSLQSVKKIDFKKIEQTAKEWVKGDIIRVDSLHKRDVWIMYSRYLNEMPIYKFHFNDPQKHQLYISSRNGEVQQISSLSERLWSYIGFIPHKFYFPFLRKHTELWINTLTIFGSIAAFAALSGIIVGMIIYHKRYKKHRKIESPYQKRWYRWHHIYGIIFGLFFFTWAFSGAMALQRIPQWMVKTENNYRISYKKLIGEALPLNRYQLDYRKLSKTYPDIKEIEWTHFQDIPVYRIISGSDELFIDASGKEVKKLYIPKNQIQKAIETIQGDSISIKITLKNKYDNYYLSRKNILPLPVYKVEVNDADQSRYYINPKGGSVRYMNKSRRVKKWMFNALHFFNFKPIANNNAVWTITIWVICLGGIFVSITGVVVSFKYIERLFKRKKQ